MSIPPSLGPCRYAAGKNNRDVRSSQTSDSLNLKIFLLKSPRLGEIVELLKT